MVSFYFLVHYNRPFSVGIMWDAASSLRHSRNPLTPASNVCEAAARPLLTVPNRFSGIWDFPYLKLGIRDLKAKSGRDSALKVRAGGGMPKITLGITGLRGISGWDYGIEEHYWGPSLYWAHYYRLNKLPEARFDFPFNLIGKYTAAFFNRPIMMRIQILIHRWGPRTKISALFRRRS